MRARAVPGSLCWAGAAWGGEGAAPLAPAPLQVLCPQGGLGGQGFVQDCWETHQVCCWWQQCQRRVLHQGRTGHSTGAVLSSPAPLPHSSSQAPCAQPTPRAKAAPAWGKMLPSCPTNPALPCVTVPSMEGHHEQSSESLHGDTVLSRGGSACTKHSATLQAGPSPADVQAWHPQSCHSPHSASSLFCQGHCPGLLARHRPRAVGGNSFHRQH